MRARGADARETLPPDGSQARSPRRADRERAHGSGRRARSARVGLGGRRPRGRRRRQHCRRRSRRPRAPASAASRLVGAPGADRLDQPRRAERDLPPPDRAARRRLRRRDVLRAVRARAEAPARRPRLRGPRLPLPRLPGSDRAARGALRPRGRAVRGRLRDVVPQPVPRPVRPGARRDGRDRRRGAARPRTGAGHCGRGPRAARRWRAGAVAGARAPAGRRPGASPPPAGRRRSTREASTTIARTAATRRSAARSSSARRASCARSPTRSSSGRGGAAFPTGVKWEAVARQPARPHYLVCNADESEPGTFKDRVLMEGDPFAVVEAMTIAAYATGCERGYLYLRGEYPEALHAPRARARRGAAAWVPRRRRDG